MDRQTRGLFHVKHDVVVVGGGHAGVEAAAAAARAGARVALVTLDPSAIGRLSCNPAVGGIGKGHLVREVDALDGLMGRVSDTSAIQFRLLNRSRGPAVRGPRAQVDRSAYRSAMRAAVADVEGLDVRAGEIADLVVAEGRVDGVLLADGTRLTAGAVVLTTGTFLGGVIHLGERCWPAGRLGEAAATLLSGRLRALGLPIGRLKTGTPPRLLAASLDLDRLDSQPGDDEPSFFHDATTAPALPQVPCSLTRTTAETHRIVRDNLGRSALYGGTIVGVGPRYCPSIEDKVVRFADRESHQVFLEPEGLGDPLVYPNGVSNSLPADVQVAFVRTMPGCARAEIVQPGYAIEYDFVDPTALAPTLELRAIPRLFLAGQINGTTGYEEAAAQGLLAGLNAARAAAGMDGLTVPRSAAYLGVMIDDLVTNGVDEPYRMFTSRAESRLMLRADNAADRLTEWGEAVGLVGPERRLRHSRRSAAKAAALDRLKGLSLTPGEAAAHGVPVREDGRRRDGLDLLAHEAGGWPVVIRLLPELATLAPAIRVTLAADALYRVHAERQIRVADATAACDAIPIPEALFDRAIPGLSAELAQKLRRRRPATLGDARRISGMTPAGLALLAAHARRAA
jgi:tRNA uridine 5-carboxymethylaminomethyl modification enzyme